MEIINGVVQDPSEIMVHYGIEQHNSPTPYTDNANISWGLAGQNLVMSAGANNKTLTFNVAPAATDVGRIFYFSNVGTGRLTIQMEATVKIADQAAGGYIYSDTDAYASIVLELVTIDMMMVRGSHATWTAGHA